MRQNRTLRASSVRASRWVWLGWAISCSLSRGDYDGPLSTLNPRNTHLVRPRDPLSACVPVLLGGESGCRTPQAFLLAAIHRPSGKLYSPKFAGAKALPLVAGAVSQALQEGLVVLRPLVGLVLALARPRAPSGSLPLAPFPPSYASMPPISKRRRRGEPLLRVTGAPRLPCRPPPQVCRSRAGRYLVLATVLSADRSMTRPLCLP